MNTIRIWYLILIIALPIYNIGAEPVYYTFTGVVSKITDDASIVYEENNNTTSKKMITHTFMIDRAKLGRIRFYNGLTQVINKSSCYDVFYCEYVGGDKITKKYDNNSFDNYLSYYFLQTVAKISKNKIADGNWGSLKTGTQKASVELFFTTVQSLDISNWKEGDNGFICVESYFNFNQKRSERLLYDLKITNISKKNPYLKFINQHDI